MTHILQVIRKGLLTVACLICCITASALDGSALRRPISPAQPAWIIHIDVWNNADPQKIIDMVPDDIRPYVIFNIATSSSDNRSPDGPAIYDSWMKVCAQNRVWTMIQCSSGAHNRMPDTPDDVSAYEQYFKDYPNFLGFHFAEQFWDFGAKKTSEGEETWPTFPERLQLFAALLPVCRQYGGYLASSFTDSYYNASKMPMAWMKRNSEIKAFLSNYPDHFLCLEKYTQKKSFYDIESNCLGQWIAGYAGQYGIRFDSSGWVAKGDKPDSETHTHYTIGTSDFIPASGAIPVAEHFMLTGQTIMDGPELITTQSSRETSTSTIDGYTCRNWEWFPQFHNISIDLFRKVLDGTIRIPSRQEVISRTKVCLVNDNEVWDPNNEWDKEPYITPERLYDGLYRHSCDQGGRDTENHWLENRWWMKSTGRYPTIPQVYAAPEGMTAFKVSSYDKPTFDAWMSQTFPAEYTGDIYASRHENGWVTYNPFQYDDVTDADGIRTLGKSTSRAVGTIPFQYNTCSSVELDYAPYSLGIMKEYADKVTFYLTNYQPSGSVSEDVIKINGATAQPQVSWSDRGSHAASSVATSWNDGVFTITVRHNGPIDLTVNCSGQATGRKTDYTMATISEPQLPAVYTGKLQYEAEHADYKSIAACRKNGYNYGHGGYQGQGFADMGTNKNGTLRFHVYVPKTGRYELTFRYQAETNGQVTISCDDVNRDYMLPTTSVWQGVSHVFLLTEGEHTMYVKNTGGSRIYADCISLERTKRAFFTPDTETGKYYVDLNDLTASGNISFNPETGVVTQTPGLLSGSLTLLLDDADFTKVTSMKVSYSGDGNAFNYLSITDGDGNYVNPEGSHTFWTSKYNLDYTKYQQEAASKAVCTLVWRSNQKTDEERTMTISDILITVETDPTAVQQPRWQSAAPSVGYTVLGQRVNRGYRGIVIANGRKVVMK